MNPEDQKNVQAMLRIVAIRMDKIRRDQSVARSLCDQIEKELATARSEWAAAMTALDAGLDDFGRSGIDGMTGLQKAKAAVERLKAVQAERMQFASLQKKRRDTARSQLQSIEQALHAAAKKEMKFKELLKC